MAQHAARNIYTDSLNTTVDPRSRATSHSAIPRASRALWNTFIRIEARFAQAYLGVDRILAQQHLPVPVSVPRPTTAPAQPRPRIHAVHWQVRKAAGTAAPANETRHHGAHALLCWDPGTRSTARTLARRTGRGWRRGGGHLLAWRVVSASRIHGARHAHNVVDGTQAAGLLDRCAQKAHNRRCDAKTRNARAICLRRGKGPLLRALIRGHP